MILEVIKQRLLMITMRTVCVLDVKKITYELSAPFVKVGAPQAHNDSSNPPENFKYNVFLAKSFYLNTLYSYCKLFN